MANADTTTIPALHITRRFAAPRETIFRAWTDPAELAQWFGPKGIEAREVKIDLRPGGSYSLKMYGTEGIYPLSGVYREVMPPERLVFTWVWGHGEDDGIEMLVTIEFTETKDGGTLLTITHERLPNAETREHHNQGWNSTLDCLAAHIAA